MTSGTLWLLSKAQSLHKKSLPPGSDFFVSLYRVGQMHAPLATLRRGGALPRPHDRCTRSYRGSASAAAALLRETVLLSAAIKKILRERAVQGYSFARGIARKEVEKPWFLPALFCTFPAAGKSAPCPGARNAPMGNLSYTERADVGAVERSGTSALGVHPPLRTSQGVQAFIKQAGQTPRPCGYFQEMYVRLSAARCGRSPHHASSSGCASFQP